MRRKLYFIDVDGTVANNDHRVHLIQNGNSDWDEFFRPEQMVKDSPIQAARAHFAEGRFLYGDFVFLTARIESTHDVTKAWLIEHGFATDVTRVICKPNIIRLQRSRVFKPSVLATVGRYDYPDREFVLIEDYGEVRRATEEAGFKTLHAPDCWNEWTL